MVTLVPTPNQDNWLEKLNEWGDRAHASINWNNQSGRQNGQAWHWATPIINGVPHPNCTGQGLSGQAARNAAARNLSNNGVLW